MSGTTLNRDIYNRVYDDFSSALIAYFKEYPDCIPQLEGLVLKHRKNGHLYHEMYSR